MREITPITRTLLLLMAAVMMAGGLPVSAAPADDEGTAAQGHGTAASDGTTESHGASEGEAAGSGHGEQGGHGGRDYNMPPLEVELPLFLWSIVTFLLFVFLARRFSWLPLIAGLNAREARVNRALAAAEAARIAAHQLLAEHQAHLDEVTEQIKAIIARARSDAEQEKARIIAEADAETSAMRDQAIAQIHAARAEALAGLDERIESQVATASRHVLG